MFVLIVDLLKTTKQAKINHTIAAVEKFTDIPHRHIRIIKSKNEFERLICGRADVLRPSSSKHPLRDDITGGTDLIVHSKNKGKKEFKTKNTNTHHFQQM